MKTDMQLKDDILAELKWTPDVNEADVGVIVKDGVVTLTGHLPSYAEKHAAERAAQRVNGVKALAVEIDVKLPTSSQRDDGDIAAAAKQALAWNTRVPRDAVHLKVEKGWVTLSGKVEWEYQRRAAYSSARNLTGVVGVSNGITVAPRVTMSSVEKSIRDALTRQAEREAKGIEVTVNGAQVTLHGKVHSWAEREAAQSAAWSAPGVGSVVNALAIA
ncbi:BON domain-containing protein [Hydrogenophaga sp. BPS33]|uniref:BON domain-containing protein n=1 Tax=Hydrogenophaga sp. BPS33 TaxID=2651974 RepID=UPI00131FC3BB|nr:BON domain-containing protein [Hydrogenophaga sp. BPS33]QHE86123.1 BON domain-containing protein [Hydrogenophaga sp. BPS33]